MAWVHCPSKASDNDAVLLAEAGKQWRAPALSSLVNRLAQPAGKQPVPSPPARSKPEEIYLDPSSDEEEQVAASAEPEEDTSSIQGGLSIYSAAAGPFRSLLACIATEPGTVCPTLLMKLFTLLQSAYNQPAACCEPSIASKACLPHSPHRSPLRQPCAMIGIYLGRSTTSAPSLCTTFLASAHSG